MASGKILVVDDEKELAELIKDYLEAEGFEVALALDGEQAISTFMAFRPDLMIVDVMLPRVDGMEVCRIIRSDSSIPILMLSAKKSDADKVLGLGLGADDYVTKPFSASVLTARVKAHLRRYFLLSNASDSGSLKFDGLEINLKSYTVTISGNRIPFSSKEFEILSFLAMKPFQVFSREQIYNNVWGYDEYGDINTVTVYINKIREKIGDHAGSTEYIKTVWGVGYKFEGNKR